MKTVVALVIWASLVFGQGAEKPTLISLGANCGIADFAKRTGHRFGSYPLDWALSLGSEAIIQMLDEDFCYFLDPQFLVVHSGGLLVNTRYHIVFAHEGDWKGENYPLKMDEFRERFLRRINRFRNLNEYKGRVFFVREYPPPHEHHKFPFPTGPLFMSRDYSIRLNRALRDYFPALDYNLFIINPLDEENNTIVKVEDRLFMIPYILSIDEMIKITEQYL